MKLYRHYKNKYYVLRGLVKHSESLEELALYDCLYENQGGKTWVRPKELFFGELEIEGRIEKRFAPVDIDICVLPGEEAFFEPSLKMIDEVSLEVFKTWDLPKVTARLRAQKNPLLLVALIDGKLAGYKLGYETRPGIYYSWLGGVLKEWRRVGIAEALLKRQHKWAHDQGYLKIQTKTKNEFKEMLILNIKSGFEIRGLEEDGKILLEKNLA